MRVFHHPHRPHGDPQERGDMVMWALIAVVVAVNVLLMWRIATGGF